MVGPEQGTQDLCWLLAGGRRGHFWQALPSSIPPSSISPSSKGSSSSPPRAAARVRELPSVSRVSTRHANYNHYIIPEQPPRCAVLFIGKQTGSRSPDKLLCGINKKRIN